MYTTLYLIWTRPFISTSSIKRTFKKKYKQGVMAYNYSDHTVSSDDHCSYPSRSSPNPLRYGIITWKQTKTSKILHHVRILKIYRSWSHCLNTSCIVSASSLRNKVVRSIEWGRDGEKLWQPFCFAESSNTTPLIQRSYFTVFCGFMHEIWADTAAQQRGEIEEWGEIKCLIRPHC